MRHHTAVAALALLVILAACAPAAVAAPPPGFSDQVVFSGLSEPTAVRFSADGRVFVAEKNGRIKVFDSLTDPTPAIFADLSTNVHSFWDRGMLGMTLAPNFPADPYVYVMYTHDAAIGGTAPRWGTGNLSDGCPNPPGATSDGCVVSSRISRLRAAGDVMTGSEQVLVEDWCQQYPSHSSGSLVFGADGALYASHGDGASFGFTDYGQDGNPVNPCGDPPGGPGSVLTPPTAQGGALRAQDLIAGIDPVGLDGSIIRIDPATGAARLDNPNALSGDANARRIIAHGLRNPFRITVRPGTSEVWAGDVGWNAVEEIDRLTPSTDPVVDNFGWPCREGDGRQGGYDGANLNICEDLYTAGDNSTARPYYSYRHSQQPVPGESCPTGGSAIAGLAFYAGGSYPDHDGALFFADNSRNCIWMMKRGTNGLPDPNQITTFVAGAPNPVDLQIGPGGDLFYVDFEGTVHRVRYTAGNQAPTAVAQATPTGGDTPLTVSFSGTASSDPEGGGLTYAWDLDDDGQYDDSTSATPTFTYTQARSYTVRLRVTDPQGESGTDVVVINAGNNSPPAPTISAPAGTLRWSVGERISFSGSAVDAQEGALPASALTWELVLHHCPSNCHEHPVQQFPGVASGAFDAPDHEYPSHLELKLTATDSQGARSTTSVALNPRTVELTFQSSPAGLNLVAGADGAATPFTRTVIAGSSNSVSAPSPQTLNGNTYTFASWSDGGAQSHNLVAPAAPTTYTATFTETRNPPVAAYTFDEGSGGTVADASGSGNGGTISGATWSTAGRFGSALSFDGADDRVVIPDSPSLDLTTRMTLEAWVRPNLLSPGWRTVLFKSQPGNLVYGIYGHDGVRPRAEAHINGGVRNAPGAAAMPLSQWTHLATTYDGSNLRFYVDGTLTGTTAITGAITASAGELWIGGNPVWPEWFSGLIDEVRIYSRTLTAGEIQADMATSVGTPDSEDPTPPTNLAATGGLGTAQLGWTAATDDVGVHRYNVHRGTSPGFTPTDANRVARPTGTSYTDGGLAAGTYYYVVTAEDAAGNTSDPSSEASATVLADTTPPTVSVIEPAGGATVSGAVTLRASAADDESVASVQFRVDGADAGAPDTTAPYSVSWDSRTVADGDHQITAVARDPSLNTRTSDPVTVTVDNPAAPPPAGLVAAYGFDEGSGSAVADASGTGNGGTIQGGAAWSPAGRFGGAIGFDGIDDRVNVPDAASLDLTTGMTLEAWVQPTLSGGWRSAIFKENADSTSYSLYANRNTGVPSSEVLLGTRLRAVNGTTALPLDQWTHVAATFDGSSIRLYVGGTLVATTARSGSIATSTGALSLGGNIAHGEWFQGRLDEVRVYNRALSAAEIQTDMTTPVGVPDGEDPTAPGGLSATGGLGSVQLSWNAADDNVGVHHYDVHRSTSAGFTPSAANRIAQPTGTSYTDGGLAAGTYHYIVVAVDATGNAGPPSGEASAAATADTTGPTVALTAPAAGATVQGTITVSADASDDDAVAGVQFKVGTANVGAEDTSAPYSVSWDTRTVADGDHQLTAVARDRSGNPRTSAPITVTVDNPAAPPPSGLVAAYGFEEASGSAVTDTSGTGNGGTISGATRSAAGRFGSALAFDGVDDRVVVPDSASLDLTAGMTLEAWVRPSVLGTAWRTVLFKAQPGNLVYGLYANDSASRPNTEAFIGGGIRRARGTAQLALDQWVHLTSTYDGTTLRLYVDGVQTASLARTGTIAVSAGELWIGGNPVWPEWFSGLIDEVRIYNRALTTPEIQGDMAAPVPGGV